MVEDNVPKEHFDLCKFYDLADALTSMATGRGARIGVDGSVKGWQEDFLKEFGLEDLTKDNFKPLGVNGAASELGLPAGIAVGSGVIANAGWLLQVHQPATLPCRPGLYLFPVFEGPYLDVLIPGYWMAEGGHIVTVELLKHVLEAHPAFQKTLSNAESNNMNIYDYLNAHLKELQTKSNAPTISYLGRHFSSSGDISGNRSPFADPRMKSAVIRVSSDKSIDGLAS
ncbi:hypothetical protein MMC31_005401 [Peltigera leucophlebia]|nr:hypothetical protein [Peltigera leucophlebia]